MSGDDSRLDGLQVATYNVHRCVGSDGRHDPERTAAVIREMRADVAALQEVDSRVGVEGGTDQFQFLARATGLHPLVGSTLRDREGQFGNAILTRLPVIAARRIDLSVPGREPRGALDVDLDAGAFAIRVVATHLGLRWRERRKQVARLVNRIRCVRHQPLLLLGDMNEWIPVGGSLGPLFRLFGKTRLVRTFPSDRPLFPLDRIWCRPSGLLREVHAHGTALARSASDHLPLRARLVLDAQAAHIGGPGGSVLGRLASGAHLIPY